MSAFPVLFFIPTSLIGSFVEVKASISDLQSYPEGTDSFKQDRHHTIVIAATAICLDALVCAGMWGLIAIFFNVISRRWQIATWSSTAIAGLGSALLRVSYIGVSTDKDFVIMVIIIPATVGVVSILGILLTIVNRRQRLNEVN